jgi:hypothetical protein
MALGLVLMQTTFTVPPANTPQALDAAIAAQINTVSKKYIVPGNTPVDGDVVNNSAAVSGFTVIITSADAVTYTAQVSWFQYTMQS